MFRFVATTALFSVITFSNVKAMDTHLHNVKTEFHRLKTQQDKIDFVATLILSDDKSLEPQSQLYEFLNKTFPYNDYVDMTGKNKELRSMYPYLIENPL